MRKAGLLGNYNISTLCVYICFQPAGIYWELYSSIIHVLISLILYQINFENHLFLHYKTSIYHQVLFPDLPPTSSRCTVVLFHSLSPTSSQCTMVLFPGLSPTSSRCTVVLFHSLSPTSSQCTVVLFPGLPPTSSRVPWFCSQPFPHSRCTWSHSPAFPPLAHAVYRVNVASIACAGLEIKHQQRGWQQLGRVWEQVRINSV